MQIALSVDVHHDSKWHHNAELMGINSNANIVFIP